MRSKIGPLAPLVLLVLAGNALADVAPPPGTKRLRVERSIQCDVAPEGYVFFTSHWDSGIDTDSRGRPVPHTDGKKDDRTRKARYVLGRVNFEPGKPQSVQGTLYAVPVDAVPKRPADEFAEALLKGKVPGTFMLPFGPVNNEVPIADPRTRIIIHDSIQRIDAKEGIIVKRVTNAPDESGEPAVPGDAASRTTDHRFESSMRWVAVSAAVVGMVLGGLWLGWRIRK